MTEATTETPTEGVLSAAPVSETLTETAPTPSLAEALYGNKEPTSAPVETKAEEPDPESKPAEAAAAEPPKEGELVAPKEGEPSSEPAPLTADSYKDLTLPEGLTVDDALFTEAKEVFAKVGIDPAKAPELLALYGKTQQQQLTNLQAEIAAQDATWSKELDAIPEFSGEQRTVAQQFIGRAIEEFGTPEVRTTLSAYGLSNNPALARFIYNMAYAIVEGEPTASGGPVSIAKNGQAGRPSLAESMYDHADSVKARTQ